MSELITIERTEYERLRALEDVLDRIQHERASKRAEGEERLPHAMVMRLAEENPIRVWREHRGLSLRALAEKAEVGAGYLSQLENGHRDGTVKTLAALAEVLGVDITDLVP